MKIHNIASRLFFRILIFFTLPFVACTSGDRYVVISGFAQGGTYSVKFNLEGRDGMIDVPVETIRDSVDSILSRIDNSLSGYNKNSLLSRFNGGQVVAPDSIFIDIYQRSYDIFEKTEGAVDVSAAPLFDIWGFGFKMGELPGDDLVQETMRSVGMNRLVRHMPEALDSSMMLHPGSLLLANEEYLPSLNYNAVAQGYSCDLVAEYLYSIGVKDMMVNIGEIYCDGLNPSGEMWTLGIDCPRDGNNVVGEELQAVFYVPSGPHGVVTSGNYRKFYIKDGKKYAHTIDPRTGYPVTHNLLSATIIASDATLADAYATYCMVIGLEKSREFIEDDPHLEGCLIYDDQGEYHMWCSSGFLVR